ncbi:unnamed protein product [Eruca vesicaria subsp. sativa]|uniref:Uncharacterized protein n=1 Tax=Eruca vesicaria subsp. sativa TaxID=29727 RepID=A0ABC8LBT5_ERUVS|nr:unnamed protein product [Eruca vesicaria subsp. sativa]
MGCCLSKKPSSIPLSSGLKPPDPVKPDVNKPEIELPVVKREIELGENPEVKPIRSEKVEKEDEEIEHRRSHERSKKIETESEEAVEKSVVVRTSSCTKEEVDAILIQCGKLSRSNSAAKTRRYSGSKRSFDFDQNERTRGGGDVEEEEAGRKTPQRNRQRGVESSPRERRRRTPSREREREREDSKSYRSGSRERGGSRRVSRSPGKRSEMTNPNTSGSLVSSSNIKFVTVPARDKSNGDPSSKRVTTVKRSIGEACRTAATSNVQPPSSRRVAEQSPHRRKPLGEIDQNATKGDKKKLIKRGENEAAKPQGISRSRSLRKSRDFDLLQSSEEDKSSYTALLLKDIKNFHGKSNDNDNDEEDPFSLLPSCVTKACSIVEAVADLNSTSDSNQFRFTSTVKKAEDLMEPSFEKYVTVKRGGCSLEEQESSCASNNLT